MAQPSIWFDNGRSPSPAVCELHIVHSSVLAGSGPVFRFDGSLVRAWVDDSVIGSAGRSPATLVMTDEPRDLIWRGRVNIYAQIGVYLAPSRDEDRRSPITDFATWEQSATELREAGSKVSPTLVWDTAD